MVTTSRCGCFSPTGGRTVRFPGRLKAKLSDEFGRSNVFFDVDNIMGGENFKVAISSSIAGVDVMLALIGSTWDPDRLQDDDDWVRLELSEALRQTKPIIPVLIDDAQMPRSRQLPPDIRELSLIQAQRVRPRSRLRRGLC